MTPLPYLAPLLLLGCQSAPTVSAPQPVTPPAIQPTGHPVGSPAWQEADKYRRRALRTQNE